MSQESTEVTEQSALATYIDVLKARNLASGQIAQCRHFLRYLLTALRGKAMNGDSYREAVDYTLKNFPEDPYFLTIVREFYAYWTGDIRTASVAAANCPFPTPEIKGNLLVVLTRVERDAVLTCDVAALEYQLEQARALQSYIERLKTLGATPEQLAIRRRLLLLLMYGLRGAAKSGNDFRLVVDNLLVLFPKTEKWHLFVALARDYYYFWVGDAHASQRITADTLAADPGELF